MAGACKFSVREGHLVHDFGLYLLQQSFSTREIVRLLLAKLALTSTDLVPLSVRWFLW